MRQKALLQRRIYGNIINFWYHKTHWRGNFIFLFSVIFHHVCKKKFWLNFEVHRIQWKSCSSCSFVFLFFVGKDDWHLISFFKKGKNWFKSRRIICFSERMFGISRFSYSEVGNSAVVTIPDWYKILSDEFYNNWDFDCFKLIFEIHIKISAFFYCIFSIWFYSLFSWSLNQFKRLKYKFEHCHFQKNDDKFWIFDIRQFSD